MELISRALQLEALLLPMKCAVFPHLSAAAAPQCLALPHFVIQRIDGRSLSRCCASIVGGGVHGKLRQLWRPFEATAAIRLQIGCVSESVRR
jgi:hypothetical protein